MRQGSEISLWVFNIFFDRVIREVNVMATGRDGNGRSRENKKVFYVDEKELPEEKKDISRVL